jgi:hypothetical protein
LSLGLGKNHLTRRASYRRHGGGGEETENKGERPLRFCNS